MATPQTQTAGVTKAPARRKKTAKKTTAKRAPAKRKTAKKKPAARKPAAQKTPQNTPVPTTAAQQQYQIDMSKLHAQVNEYSGVIDEMSHEIMVLKNTIVRLATYL